MPRHMGTVQPISSCTEPVFGVLDWTGYLCEFKERGVGTYVYDEAYVEFRVKCS